MPKRPLATITLLDLTQVSAQELVLAWIGQGYIKAVFMAPPCTTASSARHHEFEPQSELDAKPLRSFEEPDGLCDLTSAEMNRVSRDNKLYQFTADVVDLCCELNLMVTVENPRSSLFWFTTPWKTSAGVQSLRFTDHQACMYGSQRPKWVRLASNSVQVSHISKVCDHSHAHLPWGAAARGTKRTHNVTLEVHYPQKLCEAIAEAIVRHCVAQGCVPNPQSISLDDSNAAAQASFGKQARAPLPPLIPEFKAKVADLRNAAGDVVWPVGFVVPPHSKPLHTLEAPPLQDGGDATATSSEPNELEVSGSIVRNAAPWCAFPEPLPSGCRKCTIWGVPWEPQEFMDRAEATGHPMQFVNCLPECLQALVKEHAVLGDAQIAKDRATWGLKWSKEALSLEVSEQELRKTMDPLVRQAVAKKRICLFEAMLKDVGYPDMGVIDELVRGADLTGDVPLTGMLRQKYKPALLTLESLSSHSRLVRQASIHQTRSSGDAEIDRCVFESTLAEVASGWLAGPFSEAEVPLTSPISRRFGLKQKHKVRLIDDYSASAVNSAVSTCETPSLHSVNVTCALLQFILSQWQDAGKSTELSGRTFDLSSAYRQIGLSKAGRQVAFIGVFDPELQKPVFFQALVLPFGAVRSVHSFLRCARAIWFLGVVQAKLLWTSFYDDFTCFSPPELSRSTEATACLVFKLCGWLFAESGRKCMPFGKLVEALGVLLDLSSCASGIARISNTESRVAELCEAIAAIVSSGKLARKDAERLRGRMQFASLQLFGKVGKQCTRVLSRYAQGDSMSLSRADSDALRRFANLLKANRPMSVQASDDLCIFMYTDACFEPEATGAAWKAGIGGVMVDRIGGRREMFSMRLSDEMLVQVGVTAKSNIIFECETLAALVSLKLWSSRTRNRQLVLFVDNDGCKHALIAGYSSNTVANQLVAKASSLECDNLVQLWVARVPSHSNCADKPSRGERCSVLEGFAEVKCLEALEWALAGITTET